MPLIPVRFRVPDLMQEKLCAIFAEENAEALPSGGGLEIAALWLIMPETLAAIETGRPSSPE